MSSEPEKVALIMESTGDKRETGFPNKEFSSAELPTISVQREKSPSLASQFSSKSSGSRKLYRENAIDDNEDDLEGDAAKAAIIKRRMTMPVSISDFRRTLSEEAK